MTAPPPPPGNGDNQPYDPSGNQPPPGSAPPPGGNQPPPGATPPGGAPPPAGGSSPYGSGMPPAQPPYGGGAMGPGGAQPDNSAKTLGYVSLGTGIASIICCLCWPLGLVTGATAIVTGILGRNKGSEIGDQDAQRFALIGLVLGVIGLVLVAVLLIMTFVTGGFDYEYYYNSNF